MASLWTNKGLYLLLSGGINLGSDTIKVMLLDSPSLASMDVNFVDEISGDELDGTGYEAGFGGSGRKTVASKSFTENDTDDRAEFDVADLTWSAIDAGAAVMAAVIKEVTDDSASPVIGFIDIADRVTNGGDLTVNITELFRLSHAA